MNAALSTTATVGLFLEALPAGVGDGARLEEEAVVGAGERCILGHGDSATLDDLAMHGGAGGVVAAVAAYGHGPSLSPRA